MFKVLTVSLLSFSLASLLSACNSNLSNELGTDLNVGVMHGKAVKNSDLLAEGIVGIYNSTEEYMCTGSLIAPNIVLTAAHCVRGEPSDLSIIFGTNFDDIVSSQDVDVLNERMLTVTDFKVHPQWISKHNAASEGNGDIALLKFKGVTPRGYKPATFLSKISEIKADAMVTLAGYGVNKVDFVTINPKTYPNLESSITDGDVICDKARTLCMEVKMDGDGILRQTQAPITSVSKTEVKLDERMGGTCMGDSGGPAYLKKNGKFYLFGITSRGGRFCDDSGIYTNAIAYMKWIKETINNLK